MYESYREFAQTISQTSAFFASTILLATLFIVEKKHWSRSAIFKGPLRLKLAGWAVLFGLVLLLASSLFATVSVGKFPEWSTDVAVAADQLTTIYYYSMLPGTFLGLSGLAGLIGFPLED